jgi:hypothetical protein
MITSFSNGFTLNSTDMMRCDSQPPIAVTKRLILKIFRGGKVYWAHAFSSCSPRSLGSVISRPVRQHRGGCKVLTSSGEREREEGPGTKHVFKEHPSDLLPPPGALSPEVPSPTLQ